MKKRIMTLVAAFALFALVAATALFNQTVNADEGGRKAFDKIVVTTKKGNGNTIVKADGYQKASFVITSASGKVIEQTGKIKVRGNSTAVAEKKPFNIKLDEKEDLFGMGKGKKWCLLANCFDPTLLRNYLAFNFAAELGLKYTSESRFIELYVDGVYKGCYLIAEPVESGKTRINIDPEETEDFILEFEAYRDEELVAYVTADEGRLRWAVSEPEMPDPADYDAEEEDEAYIADMAAYDARVEAISAVINNVVDTIKAGDFDAISEVIDIDSFAQYYVLNEYFKTCDFKWSSVFFYFQEGKLYAGPAWDYDLSTGNMNPAYPSLIAEDNVDELAYVNYYTDFTTGVDYDKLYANGCNVYTYLTQNDDFMKVVGNLYLEKQDYITNLYAQNGMIDSLCAEYEQLFAENFETVENGGAGWIVSKAYADTMRVPDATFAENVEYLSNWLENRNAFLLTELSIKPVIKSQTTSVSVIKNEIAELKVDARGIALKYQWQLSKNGGKKWKDIAGANGSTYSFEAGKNFDANLFRCVITNEEGEAITDVITMSVSNPPKKNGKK